MKHLAAASSLLPKAEALILPAVRDAGEIKATEKAPHCSLQLVANVSFVHMRLAETFIRRVSKANQTNAV